MNHPVSSKPGSSSGSASHKAKSDLEKAKSDLRILQAQFKAEQKVRLQTEKTLTEVQEALSTSQAALEQARLDGLKAAQERQEADQAHEDMAPDQASDLEQDPVSFKKDDNGGEQRVSFMVRLVVDEQGQPKRTEVEQVQTGMKESFPTLNAQRLEDFITSNIVPARFQEPSKPLVQANLSASKKPKLKKPENSLQIIDIEMICTDNHGNPSIIIAANQQFFIQVSFRIDEAEAALMKIQNVPYELVIRALGIDEPSSVVVVTKSSSLLRGKYHYQLKLKIPGLPHSIYRLFLILKLLEPANTITGFQGSFLQVGF